MPPRRLYELAAVQIWELVTALIFHNITIIISAWIGFVVGRRTLEMDALENAMLKRKTWDEDGS